MLNFLTPPTDNVYKFMGIGGLFIFITCGVFLFFGMYQDDYKLTLAKGELYIEETKLKTVINDLEFLSPDEALDDIHLSKLKAWANHLTDTSYSNDPIFIESYYSLTDSVRNKIEAILFVRLGKQFKYNAINQQINGKKNIENVVLGCWIFGEVIGFLGIFLWYLHLQKPLDDDRKKQETQKLFTGIELSEYCHSCYMTFYFNTERGTEKDGTMSRFFCKTCYGEGKYLEPDLTFEDAKKRLITKLQELNYKNRRIKKIEKDFAKLLRWERLRTW